MHRTRQSPSGQQSITNASRAVTKRRRSRILSQALASCCLSGWLLLVLSVQSGAVSASPVAPPGATGLQDLLNWTLYGGAIACAATAMFGFAKMGISHTQQSYQGANHGKSVAILGLLGALGLGLTPTIVNGLTAIH